MALMKEVNDVVYKIIGSCMEVHRNLGPGFPVDFYRKGLEVEFAEKELPFELMKSLQVIYKDVLVGTQVIDFMVDEKVVVAIRAQGELKDIEIQQVLRCLTLTASNIGVLVNFGLLKLQYKRILPSRQSREVRQEQQYRPLGYRELGKTREGNPVV